MDRTSDGFLATFHGEITTRTIHWIITKLQILFPSHEFEPSTTPGIEWKSWPGKTTIMKKSMRFTPRDTKMAWPVNWTREKKIIKHRKSRVKTSLETSGGSSWNTEDLNKFRIAFESLGADISEIPTTIPSTPTTEIDAINMFPTVIYAIIMGYVSWNLDVFPSGMLTMFAQTYFPGKDFCPDVDMFTVLGKWKYINDPLYIGIYVDSIKYTYSNGEIFIEDNRILCGIRAHYKHGEYMAHYSGTTSKITRDQIMSIPIEVIEYFDLKDEFGLQHKFEPIISMKSLDETIANPAYIGYKRTEHQKN